MANNKRKDKSNKTMSYYSICPDKIDGCTIDDVYKYTFSNCTDIDRILFLGFELRLQTYLDLFVRGQSTDDGHVHVIDLAGFYYAKCLVFSRGLSVIQAVQQANFIYMNAHKNYRLIPTRSLFSTLESVIILFDLPPMTDRCIKAIQSNISLKKQTNLANNYSESE